MLLTVKDLSAWLNMKPSTLYLWAAQGKIPCRKIHGLIRFEREAITRWLDSFPGGNRQPFSKSLHAGKEPLLDALIATATREAYTARHGETTQSSLIRKEDSDGAV